MLTKTGIGPYFFLVAIFDLRASCGKVIEDRVFFPRFLIRFDRPDLATDVTVEAASLSISIPIQKTLLARKSQADYYSGRTDKCIEMKMAAKLRTSVCVGIFCIHGSIAF